MSFGFSPQRVDGLRFDARCLVEWLRDQEAQVAMFVASADGDLRQAEADVSPDAAALGPNELRHLLASQLERRLATASAASSLRPASSMRRRVVYCTSSKVATPTVNKQA
ncbi:MAG TPA: hypothetical protein VFO36_10350, partial [Nitrospiraceae bacterium]|nr:hypothetical protein [Nitrospiraceae bacterium]